MRELYNLFEIVENNEVCVVVRPSNDATALEILGLGCFDGDEEVIRITKGNTTTATVITYNDKKYQWQWGEGAYTLVSDNIRKKGHLLKEMLEVDFGIYMGSNFEKIKATKNIKEIGKAPPTEIKIMYFEKSDNNVVVHKDGEFLKRFSCLLSGKSFRHSRQ